eukprot:12605708-Alexandrium_andersonii.AAC.1
MGNIPEPMKTHLQLNVSQYRDFESVVRAVELYLRSRRSGDAPATKAKDGSTDMDVDAIAKGKKGGKKGSKGGKKNTQSNYKFDGECRNCGKWGHRAKDCWAPGGGAAQDKNNGG